MPYFATAEEVGDHLGRLLQDVTADAEAATALTRGDVVVRLDLRNPDAEITLDLRGAGGPSATVGPSELPPHVTLRMESDTAHRFLLGAQNVPVAVARGRIQADGDAGRVLAVLDLPRHTAGPYARQLRAADRDELADVRDEVVLGVVAGDAASGDGATAPADAAPTDAPATADGAPVQADHAPAQADNPLAEAGDAPADGPPAGEPSATDPPASEQAAAPGDVEEATGADVPGEAAEEPVDEGEAGEPPA